MIGRFDSTPDRRRARRRDGAGRRAARAASILAVAALLAVAGPRPAARAQAPRAQAPKAQVKGITLAPTEPPAPVPGRPDPIAGPTGGMPPLTLPGDGPPPGPLSTLPADDPRPRRDPLVEPAEAAEPPGDDKGPLPEARLPTGSTPPPAAGPAEAADPFALPPDRLGLGKQRVQLSVEVQAGKVVNLGKEAPVKLVVTNESNADASGVSVVYQLPDGLQLVSSTPEATPVPANKALFHWKKPMLAASAEWVIVLKVVATEVRSCEHAATVTAKTGSRAATTVQEPKLKVEAIASPGRLLKGSQVTFQIAVTNPGSGPARNVTVQAKLSSGLRLGNEDLVEQTIAEILPGGRVELDPLIVDTVAGGQQTCTVNVQSPDVNPVAENQRVIKAVEVTRPDLTVKLTGQEFRYTGQTSEYKLTVSNPGTAPVKKVKVAVSLPSAGGKLIEKPSGATFDVSTRKLFWNIAQIEPNQSVDMTFLYGTSTPGLYRAAAEATSGEIHRTDTITTEVSGIAVLELQITPTARVIDVGKTAYYDIVIKNTGSKGATRLQLSGDLTNKYLKPVKFFGLDNAEVKYNVETGKFVFPEIDHLDPGQSITVSLQVQATQAGPAGAHVFLAHAEMGPDEAKIEDVVATIIPGNRRPTPTAK